jgi:hypothetical protein
VQRDWGTDLLRVSVLGPLDLLLSKLCRCDEDDLADIRFLVETQRLSRDDIEAAMASALVPPEFAGVFPRSCRRVLALLGTLPPGGADPARS